MPSEKITHKLALDLLHNNMESVNLRRHCYAVSVVMRAIYNYFKSNNMHDSSVDKLSEEDWGVVGLLHDADYEKTKEETHKHTIVLLDWLCSYEVHEHIIEAFKSHNTKITNLRSPETLLEWSLECCDELTGFIVACALVQPDKKLSSVTPESIMKKWKAKEFARNVDRDQIAQCETKLNIPLETFINIALTSMQAENEKLGL